ncbi:MAG: class I SAM-dependent methyltransferase [Candidatus Obscuribacterales bacterium]|nr:class I SAM-dependent methyltransferase [Candidatus Obscuribacterales bacterium]
MLSPSGIELKPTDADGISRVEIKDSGSKQLLTWDRYVRLNAASQAIKATGCITVLDAGGFDGALGLFLPDRSIDLIDPATTGGSVLQIPAKDNSYDLVAAIDVLEHIEPKDRLSTLKEFARVAKNCIILNYPCRDSKSAQELVLKLTGNELIRQHVEWELPDSNWVLSQLAKYGFAGTVTPHTSIAVWIGQYVSLNLAQDKAALLNQHLVENYANEPTTRNLYHLLVCKRN